MHHHPPAAAPLPPTASHSPMSFTTDMGWGAGSWPYQPLNDPLLTSELIRLSLARSHGDTDSLSFQPCQHPSSANQDRYVVQDWSLPDGPWSFRAIFDGHAGHATVDHVVQTLPGQIREKLQHAPSRDPDSISKLLTDAVVDFDDSIQQNFLRLIPDTSTIGQMSEDQLHALIHDIESSPEKNAAIKRCMHGSTALVALVDPSRRNLWVASLGDSQAALGQKDKSGKWSTSFLSSFHNGRNEEEVERIRQEHPNEECVHNGRVLGAIAVTRALGDFEFKLPAILTDRVLARTNPGFKFSATTLPAVLARTLTPPYLSSRPDVQHVSFTNRDQYQEIRLIMCSDGLLDLYLDSFEEPLTLEQLPSLWFDILDHRDTSLDDYNNLSLALLRHAIGGNDLDKVSRNMTVKVNSRWMDDTTILIQKI